MTYDLDLANRVRALLADRQDVLEKPMFGGLAFLLSGNMAVALSSNGGLIVRVGPAGMQRALQSERAEPLQMRGRPMTGWVVVSGEAVAQQRRLEMWVRHGVEFASTLPPKRRASPAG